MIEFARHFLLISVIFISLVVLIIMAAIKDRHGRTISQLIALRRPVAVVFGLMLMICTVGFAVFIYGWFAPYYNLSLVFKILAGLLLLCTATIALSPHSKRSELSSKIHNKAAWCGLYVAFALIIDLSIETLGQVSLLNSILLFGLVIYCIFFKVFFSRDWFRQRLLFFESGVIAWFLLAIISLTYFD